MFLLRVSELHNICLKEAQRGSRQGQLKLKIVKGGLTGNKAKFPCISDSSDAY